MGYILPKTARLANRIEAAHAANPDAFASRPVFDAVLNGKPLADVLGTVQAARMIGLAESRPWCVAENMPCVAALVELERRRASRASVVPIPANNPATGVPGVVAPMPSPVVVPEPPGTVTITLGLALLAGGWAARNRKKAKFRQPSH